MASDQIVLFDLASRPPRSTWSLNPWKTRLLLNYKGLNYRTEWLEYPEIAPRLRDHVKPNAPPATAYTIPTVLFPDGTYTMDSLSILDQINTRYPEPPLPVKNRYFDWFTLNYGELMTRFKGIYLPTVPRTLLSEKSIPYWNQTRQAANGGMDLATLEREIGGEKGWELVRPLLKEITALLEENAEEGPFFEGEKVGYVDFWWGGFLLFCKRMGNGIWERLLQECGSEKGAERHVLLLKGLEKWSERCDY